MRNSEHRSRTWWWIGGGALVVVIILGVAWVNLSRMHEKPFTDTFSGLLDIYYANMQYQAAHSDKGFAHSLQDLEADHLITDRLFAKVDQDGYYFSYTPGAPDAQGRIATYSLDARPKHYGAKKSSFRLDESEVIYQTTEDRAATVNDVTVWGSRPELPASEASKPTTPTPTRVAPELKSKSVTELVADAKSKINAGSYEEAIAELKVAQSKEPTNTEIDTLLKRAQNAKRVEDQWNASHPQH